MKELIIIDGDDWVGFYQDGKLLWQGHSPNLNELSQILTRAGLPTEFKECGGDWLYDRGDMPEDLSEVKLLGD
jgi:hypothetical protein